MWVIVSAVAYFTALGAGLLIGLVRLTAERIDIRSGASPFSGASRVWQLNVLRPSNYTPRGRKLLIWFDLGQAALLIGIVLFGFALVTAT
jgi:hypothetical protein